MNMPWPTHNISSPRRLTGIVSKGRSEPVAVSLSSLLESDHEVHLIV